MSFQEYINKLLRQEELKHEIFQQKIDCFSVSFLEESDQLLYISQHINKSEEENEKLQEILRKLYGKDDLIAFLNVASKAYLTEKDLENFQNLLLPEPQCVEEMIEKAINADIRPLKLTIERILKVSGVSHKEINWARLYMYVSGGSDLKDYFEEMYLIHSMEAPYPIWVSIKENENKDLLQELKTEELLTQDSFAEFLDFSKVDEDDFVKDLFKDLNKIRGTEETRDRLFGMCNPRKKKCCSYDGNCRMLECECYSSINPEDEYEEKIWFMGYCQKCFHRIRHFSHAIRYPLEKGGWEGCFCSLDCMEQVYEKNIRTHALKILVDTVGIVDRLKLL